MIMRRSFSLLALTGLAIGGGLLLSGTAKAGNRGKVLPKGDEFSDLAIRPSEVDAFGLMESFCNEVTELGGPVGLHNFALVATDSETLGTANYLVGLGNNAWFPAWTIPNTNAKQSTRDTESRAARNGYMDNPKSMQSSPYNYQNWCFGSGGWFGFLPSTALGWIKKEKDAWGDNRYSPLDVFDPWRSTVALADFCYRVQSLGQWKALPPQERTWRAVKRAMRGLAALSDWKGEGAGATVNASFLGRLDKYGIDRKFANTLVPKRPENWSAKESWNLRYRIVPSAYLLPNGGMDPDSNA